MAATFKAGLFSSLLAISISAFGSDLTAPDSLRSVTHLRAECGDPALESMAWLVVNGEAIAVRDGNLIAIIDDKDGREKTVRLVAIEPPGASQPKGYLTMETLNPLLLNKRVEVLVEPEGVITKKSNALTGILHVSGIDVGLRMIELGHAKYQKPAAYTMSNFTACRYRIAEKIAKQEGLGIWRNSKDHR